MAKKGIFPIIREETHSTTGATTWGDDTTKEVGVIKITANHAVDFDGDNFPGEPGDMVLVTNAGETASVAVTIAPDPLGDDSADTVNLGVGDTVAAIYHPTNGWMFMSVVGAV